jgi:hypothetical protein
LITYSNTKSPKHTHLFEYIGIKNPYLSENVALINRRIALLSLAHSINEDQKDGGTIMRVALFYQKTYLSILIILLGILIVNGCAPAGILFLADQETGSSDETFIGLIFLILGLIFMFLSWILATDKSRNPFIWTSLSFLLGFLPLAVLYNLENLQKEDKPSEACPSHNPQQNVVSQHEEKKISSSLSNKEMLSKIRRELKPGISLSEVITLLGPPSRSIDGPGVINYTKNFGASIPSTLINSMAGKIFMEWHRPEGFYRIVIENGKLSRIYDAPDAKK